MYKLPRWRGVHRTAIIPLTVSFFFLIAVAVPGALADKVLIDMDSVIPSGGSGYEGSLPPPTMVEVEMEVVDTPSPKASVADTGSQALTPSAALSWDGISQVPSPDAFEEKPPDTHIAVGTGAGAAGRVVEITNNGVAIYDKAGSVVAALTDLDSFVTTTAGGFDPKVLFDQHSGRFFAVILDGTTPNPGGTSNVHIAVSTNATPGNLLTSGGGADWTAYSASALTNIGGQEGWFDYPGIGADSDSLFVTGNMFNAGGGGIGTKIRVYNKADLLTGTQTFTDIDISTGSLSGISTVQPCHTYGTTDNGNFYLINRFGSTAYRLWEITGDPASPSLVAGTYDTTRTWAAGASVGAGAPQAGTTGIEIDTLSPRIINAVYRGGSIWCALSANADGDGKTEVVWFEINTNGGNPTAPSVAQTGYIDGSDTDEWTFLPSINVNMTNDVVICYAQSFTDQFVDMRVVARHSTDPPGMFQSSVVLKTSVGEYDDFGATDPDRWGDYSACVIDPDDDSTFWVAHEYCNVAVNLGDDADWGTWIAELGTVIPVPVELSGFTVE